jgi:hypothetical protein
LATTYGLGVVTLGIAIVALFAGYSLLGGGTFGKVVAHRWAILVIVNSFLVMGVAPWFAFTPGTGRLSS